MPFDTGPPPPPPPPGSTTAGGLQGGGSLGSVIVDDPKRPPDNSGDWTWDPQSKTWVRSGWGVPTATPSTQPTSGATTAKFDAGAGATTTDSRSQAASDAKVAADKQKLEDFKDSVAAAAGFGGTEGHWETVTSPNGTNQQVWRPPTKNAPPAPRETPQAAPAPLVTSDVSTVEKPTAAVATAAAPVTATSVVAPTIAPIERIKAATVAQGPQATAGQVAATYINTDPQIEFRRQQARLTDALEAQAAGKEAGSAELLARRQAQEAAANARSNAASVHGYGGLAAQRTAGRTIAGIESRASLDQALLRQKGMEDARSQLAGVLGQGREQDIGLATKQAELTQGAGTTNASLTTQVSISNADREAARLKTDAELQQAAAVGDAAAQNELNTRQAALKLAADTTTSEQKLKADQGNQTTETGVNLANAANATNTAIVGATEANKVSLANAEQDLRGQIANADNQTKTALANAGFTLEGRQIDDTRNIAAVKSMLEAQQQYLTKRRRDRKERSSPASSSTTPSAGATRKPLSS
jgi:hypothetical protein